MKEFLAKGKRGIVSLTEYGGKRVIVKERNPDSVVDTVAHEAAMLQIVNAKGIGPAFIALNNGELIREYIDGEEIGPWLQRAEKEMIRNVLLDILEQCRKLDLLGINKLEMTHPHKHILVRKDQAVFIDFERAKQTQNPKNVTQVCQWMTSTDIARILEEKGIIINREAMLSHAREYKKQHDVLAYERMREVIQHA